MVARSSSFVARLASSKASQKFGISDVTIRTLDTSEVTDPSGAAPVNPTATAAMSAAANGVCISARFNLERPFAQRTVLPEGIYAPVFLSNWPHLGRVNVSPTKCRRNWCLHTQDVLDRESSDSALPFHLQLVRTRLCPLIRQRKDYLMNRRQARIYNRARCRRCTVLGAPSRNVFAANKCGRRRALESKRDTSRPWNRPQSTAAGPQCPPC